MLFLKKSFSSELKKPKVLILIFSEGLNMALTENSSALLKLVLLFSNISCSGVSEIKLLNCWLSPKLLDSSVLTGLIKSCISPVASKPILFRLVKK